MMRKRSATILSLTLILAFLSLNSAFAEPVDPDQAIEVGRTHLEAQKQLWESKPLLAPEASLEGQIYSIHGVRKLEGDGDGEVLAYVLDLTPEGYIITSPDTDIHPIVAYSFDGRFSMEDTEGNVLLHLVRWDMQNRLEILSQMPEQSRAENNDLWERYLIHEESLMKQLSSAGQWGAWLKTKWHQGSPYNKYCPCLKSVLGVCVQRAVVGCTATAMAQIINYWEYPDFVSFDDSSDDYTTKTEGIVIDDDCLNNDFPCFNELTNKLSSIKYDGDEDEAAALAFAAGISVEMDYQEHWWLIFPDAASAAAMSADAYKNKFGYAQAEEKCPADSDFYDTLEQNMKNGQPAQLTIYKKKDGEFEGGHSIVVDGFKETGEYHLRFGQEDLLWSTDGWYFPPPTDTPDGYNVWSYAVVNVYPGEVQSAIGKGLQWLRHHQGSDGCWENSVGITGLAVLAFLNHGIDETDPDVAEAIQCILDTVNTNGSIGNDNPWGEPAYAYDTSIAILALVAADRTNDPSKYGVVISDAAGYLLNIQNDEDTGYSVGNKFYGGWGYPRYNWADLSNTQWVLAGLDAAYDYLGHATPDWNDPPNPTWTSKALQFLDSCQRDDGGFDYFEGSRGYSYGSMSYAGLWSLLITTQKPAYAHGRIGAVEDWIRGNYSVDENPGWGDNALYYYYVTMAKALAMDRWETIQGHDWFEELTGKLETLQDEDGYWVNSNTADWEGVKALTTAYALLALETQLLPIGEQLSWVLTLASHADLHLYDAEGRHVGKNYETGGIDEEIPGSSYDASGTQSITIGYPYGQLEAGSYRIELVGTSDGSYNLTSEGYQEGIKGSSRSFSGEILQDETKSTTAVLAATVGALTIYIGEPTGVVSGLVATPGDSTVDLSWDAYTQPSFQLQGYNVYRSTSSGAGYSKVNSTLLTETSYRDTDVTNRVTYYYRVTAVDIWDNETAYSREVSATPGEDQIVLFPDPNLEAAVRQEIGKPTGAIRQSDVEDMWCLSAYRRGVVDLTGLEHCPSLIWLYAYDNQISDLSPISGLQNLKQLDLSSNPINDLSPLSGLTSLEYLYLRNSQATDVSPLLELTNLVALFLCNNQVSDISVLAELVDLILLDLGHNQIIDIAPLVSNAGIDSGDDVDVRWNHLCLAPGSDDMEDINTLLGRGVNIEYTPQTVCAETNAVFKVDEQGNVLADQAFFGASFQTGTADVAEWVPVSEPVEPGDVVELDPDNPGRYRKARGPCSTLVGGVVSSEPGVVLGAESIDENKALLALMGIVPVKVIDEGGPIQPGDLLTTSSVPGYAMRWDPSDGSPCNLVGKALEPLESGRGEIFVLLMH